MLHKLDYPDSIRNMNRLSTILPEWTRIIWSNQEAKNTWAPRISKISASRIEVEQLAVVHGVTPSTLQVIDSKYIRKCYEWCHKYDLHAVPLAIQNQYFTYKSSSETYVDGNPFNYRIAITKQEHVDKWYSAWDFNGNIDNKLVGKLLGYPECCIEFFNDIWVDQKFLDTSWPMYTNTSADTMPGYDSCNILLRWLGVRSVSHLPCKFTCEKTHVLALQFNDIMKEYYPDEYEWQTEMLSWPVEWSALHGIAEIKTPILKISTRTDVTGELYRVRREGANYPTDVGASGTVFPYVNKQKVLLTDGKSFKSSFQATKEKIEYLWKDNGFSSLHNMDMAHYPIVQFITDTVLPLFPKSNDPLHVIDFGCGNGELLFKLQHCDTNSLKLYGVDVSEEKIIRADKRMGKSGLFEIGNIFPIDGHLKLLPPEKSKYDIAIFMPGRILDHSGIDAENTLRQLRHIATYIVIYAYGDWTSGFTIEKLLNKVGWDSVDIQLNDTKVVGLLK